MSKKQSPCPKCGAKEFVIRYTESAHARVNDEGEVIEDGLNLVSHEDHWDQAWCAKCDSLVKWVVEVP